MQQKPPYPIESVDNALRLLQLLRDGGSVRLTDAAEELGIAPSTAHRLMAMLTYRGFALQDDHRRYVAGPALGTQAIGAPWLHDFKRLAMEHMERLSSQVGETVNLVVRVGANIRFLATVEAHALLRIGDRTGTVMPAAGASSGKALLAYESEQRLQSLFTGKTAQLAGSALSDAEYQHLLRELSQVRKTGYALSREETEPGVGAIGMAIFAADQVAVAGISVATPMGRLEAMLEPERLALMRACQEALNAVVAETRPVH